MGGSFPTVRELAEDAGVNRNTMQRALSELEHDGFVITNRTAGRTVTTDEGLVARMKEQIAMQNIEKFIREMEAIGYDADDIVKMIQERGVEEEMKTGILIQCSGLCKDFGRKEALKDVDLRIGRGKIIGLLANGSGKTTLIKLLNGLIRPTKGEILIDGVRARGSTRSL